jgi:hypothetical protein
VEDATGAISISNSFYLFTTTQSGWTNIIEEIEMRTSEIIEPGQPVPQGSAKDLTITTINDRPGIALDIIKILKINKIRYTKLSINSIELPGEHGMIRAVQLHFKLNVPDSQEEALHRAIDDIRYLGQKEDWKIEPAA